MSDYWNTLTGGQPSNPWLQGGPQPPPLPPFGTTLNTSAPAMPPAPAQAAASTLTPGPGPPPPMDPADRDNLIKTVYGEASGEPALGQAGVAHAIFNRLAAGGYGDTISQIVKAPAAGVNPKLGYHEFSPWNPPGVPESNPKAQNLDPNSPDYARIGDVVDKAYYGGIPDPTGGATHYYGYMPRPPKWAGPLAAQNKVKIGNQTFVGGAGGPGQRPTVVGALAGG